MPKRKPIVPMKYPHGPEYAYRKILLNLNRQYKVILKKQMSPHVVSMATEATAVNLPTGEVRQDALGWQDTLNNVMRKIAEDMTTPTNNAIKQMLRIGPQINQANKDQWRRLIRSQYGVDVIKEDPTRFNALLANWSRNNSLLIKDIPSKTSSQIAEQTRTALIEGTNLKDLTKEIFDIMSERTDVSDSRAKLIARDQTAKLNGQLTQERQQDIGVESYVWRTMGDERVRDTHDDNDGETFAWDNPPVETGHPGEDYQCRCWAEPVLPEFVAYEASLLEEAA
jgi:SPP1 gp7 family putative phage head morphogenesis protein